MTTTATVEKEQQQSEAAPQRPGQSYRPHVDILELASELVLVADLPGAHSESIDVRFEDGQLSLRAPVGERRSPDQKYLLREYGVGEYHRTFRVSEQIDASRITASFTDGVLTVHLPKVEALQPRKIVVQS